MAKQTQDKYAYRYLCQGSIGKYVMDSGMPNAKNKEKKES